MIIEKMAFLVFMVTIASEINSIRNEISSLQLCCLSIQTIPEKIKSNRKRFLKKVVAVSFPSLLRTQAVKG